MTANEIHFNEGKLEEARNLLKHAQVDDYQMGIVNGVAEVVDRYVPMEILAIRGFILFAIRDWQNEAGIPATDINAMQPEDRVAAVARMFDFLTQRLGLCLQDESHKKSLEEAVQKGLAFYKETFSNR